MPITDLNHARREKADRKLDVFPLQAVHLYNGETYDRALAQYYLMTRRYSPTPGRFTSLDPYPGEVQAPACLQQFGFAGKVAVNGTDPR